MERRTVSNGDYFVVQAPLLEDCLPEPKRQRVSLLQMNWIITIARQDQWGKAGGGQHGGGARGLAYPRCLLGYRMRNVYGFTQVSTFAVCIFGYNAQSDAPHSCGGWFGGPVELDHKGPRYTGAISHSALEEKASGLFGHTRGFYNL